MKSIALCAGPPELASGGFRDPALCAKYRGSGWAPYFVELAKERGYEVIPGATALDDLSEKYEETLIVQEELNAHGFDIFAAPRTHAKRSLLFSFESPLYAPEFYDLAPELKKTFERQMLFSGGTDPVYFPSFDWHEVRKIRPWSERKGVCLVAANKHYSMLPNKPDSPSFQQALKDQLHDMRYRAIERLRLNYTDIYGAGWGVAGHGPVADKIETLSQYKYAFCFENVSQPGYITEKIIDCLVAGTVPIYMGAPDIWKRVPHMAMLDWAFDSSRLHDDFLSDEADWTGRVQCGRRFLYESGWKYSYPGFAQWVMDILEGKV